MRGARAAEAAHEGLYGLSRLAWDEGGVVRAGCFDIKTEARSEHEGIRPVSNRVLVKEVEGVLRQVLVVWVAQKQHEDAALHHDFGGKLHMQTCALGLVQRHHLPIGSVRPDTQETSSPTQTAAAAAAPPDLKACAARNQLCAALPHLQASHAVLQRLPASVATHVVY